MGISVERYHRINMEFPGSNLAGRIECENVSLQETVGIYAYRYF